MRYVLLFPAGQRLDEAIQPALDAEGIEVRLIEPSEDLAPDELPTVLVLPPAARPDYPADALRGFSARGGGVVGLGAPGEADLPSELPEDVLTTFLTHPCGAKQLLCAIRAAYREAASRAEAERARREAASRTGEIGELTRIGIALSTQRDLKTLLDMILTQARHITQSDAGSLYLVERVDDTPTSLKFVLAQGESRPNVPFVEFTMPIDHKSMAGYVASTGESLVIDDAYFLAPDVEYVHNRSFDERYDYRTKSMLTIPMSDHKDQIVGVLQLINRKRNGDAILETSDDFDREVVPYSKRTVELVSALAGQAAVAIENSALYADIERLFEGFVRASVTAIEQRDPTTFGHSGRVANMTVRLADKVSERVTTGPLREIRFTEEQKRELRYAGLLHDFGKVGVKEQVLKKENKLYDADLSLVRQRYAYVRRTAERDFLQQRVEFLEAHGLEGYRTFLASLEVKHGEKVTELENFLQLVLKANEPTILPAGNFDHLVEFNRRTYVDIDGREQQLLSDQEFRFLSVRKGSLDDTERAEIESHVTYTYSFLRQIPWTRELRSIPTIAFGHHEKLDGSGYPRKVTAAEIPIQTRMMTISDIYDALTATDRKYRPAASTERALDIIASEVKLGQIDPELFQVFVDCRAFEAQHEDR